MKDNKHYFRIYLSTYAFNLTLKNSPKRSEETKLGIRQIIVSLNTVKHAKGTYKESERKKRISNKKK